MAKVNVYVQDKYCAGGRTFIFTCRRRGGAGGLLAALGGDRDGSGLAVLRPLGAFLGVEAATDNAWKLITDIIRDANELMLEFYRMNLANARLCRAAGKNALSDQVANLKFVLDVWLTAFLIDDVLQADDMILIPWLTIRPDEDD